VIGGFKRVWDERTQGSGTSKPADLDWDAAWPALIQFFENILTPEAFWTEAVENADPMTPHREWIPGIVAELLRAGVRDDKTAFDHRLLDRSWRLIDILLLHAEGQDEASDTDAMNTAINTTKGKAIEAMLDQALRACRVSDARTKSHEATWAAMEPAFDREIAKCRGANFEFSTLAAAYIAQLRYLSLRWYEAHIRAIFPLEHPSNFLSALDGLAYAQPSKVDYESLIAAGVIDHALRQDMKDQSAREKLLQRISLAYIWEQETLEGPRLGYLFTARRYDDLVDIAKFLWSVRHEKLDPTHVERILLFWDHCLGAGTAQSPLPRKLLSDLSLLACYVAGVGERELALLLAVAPHVAVGYQGDEFIEQLGRLAPANPSHVATLLGRVLEHYNPSFDFEDRLKNLLRELSKHAETKPQALAYADHLVPYLSSMLEFYRELASG
jgi:hypothetical protein